MTIKELKPLIGKAWLKAYQTTEDLKDSENPQIMEIRARAVAEESLLTDIINAMAGDAVLLKIRGEKIV